MRSLLALYIFVQLATLSASHSGDLRVEIEASVVDSVPEGWEVQGRAASSSLLELTFAVKQQNLEVLHRTLLRVSSPTSPSYGEHLSRDEVNALTEPRAEHISAVDTFLGEHGVTAQAATLNKDLIVAHVTVAQAEHLLQTEYVTLRHRRTGANITRALGGYSVPQAVSNAVDFIAPTVHIPGVATPPLGHAQGKQEGATPENNPKNLRTLYNVGSVVGKAPNNKQAVTAFLEQYYSKESLADFWQKECKESGIECGKGEVKLVGDATKGHPGVESMLDIEYITGLAGNVESEFWGFAGRSPDNRENEPFMKWLTTLSSTSDEDVPKVFSTSYGEDEASWSLPAATRLNVEFQKAGVRGITLLYAAGDEGANCKGGKYVPEGPGSSPYVTSVGGTGPGETWPKPGADSEVAVSLSSGGFSNYWVMPDYQKDAVAAYLAQSGLPDQGKHGFNTSGRAYPDIAAQATNFFVYAGGPEPFVAGTSCASPTAAGVFSLLNDLRLQQGKSTLGFLNPLIYANPSAFNDITSGSSGGCLLEHGWPAKAGWDAVTGHGTPDYSRLADVVLKLPAGKQVEHYSVLVV